MKRALGNLVDQIIYCTDSTIALSWCRNLKIKLRLFVYNRVMTILQTVEFSQFNEDKVLLVNDQLKLDNSNEVEVMVECHDSTYETSHHITVSVRSSDSSLSSVGSARVQVN